MQPAHQAPKEYLSIVSQLEIKLASNDGSPNNLTNINYLQRSLADLAVYAFKVPEFFSKEIMTNIYDLLTQAGQYLRGTLYESRGLERPDEFLERVNSMKRAAESVRKLKEALLRTA